MNGLGMPERYTECSGTLARFGQLSGGVDLMRVGALVVGLTVLALGLAATATGGPSAPAAIPGCAKSSLNLVADGKLSLATDNPAYPPWWGGAAKKPWEISNPASGKGYESAVAYAVAKQLGFSKGQVAWSAVPFNNSFRPGKKPFDFYMAQVSFNPARAKNVAFSNSYYFVNQAVVANAGTPISNVKTVAGLRPYKLGAQVGTTSYDYIKDFIRPSQDAAVYDSNNDAISALQAGQIDGIVVDLPTAFYVVAAQLDDGTIVGKLPQRGAREHFGLVFEKGNPLVRCVNRALNRLWANGTIKALQRTYLARAGAPDLK
jgi:polar amino acid transport system substrate-binding protein